MAEETSSLFAKGEPSTWDDEKLVLALTFEVKNEERTRVGDHQYTETILRQSAIKREILKRMAR